MTTLADAVGTIEIADMLGVSYNTVRSWIRRHDDFPAPAATISGTPIWDRVVVIRWASRNGRCRHPFSYPGAPTLCNTCNGAIT